jgi:hypothetical protein
MVNGVKVYAGSYTWLSRDATSPFDKLVGDAGLMAKPGLEAALAIGLIHLGPMTRTFAPLGAPTTLGNILLTPAQAGRIIGWGAGQAGAAATRQLLSTLTREQVKGMMSQGLRKHHVQQLLGDYARAIASAGAKLQNTQLFPRYQLMQRILALWPK